MIPDFRYFTLIAACATLLLSAWLLYLNPTNRLHRAFALFLMLRGLAYLLQIDGDVASWQGAFVAYLLLALPFAGIFLMLRLRECFLLREAPPTRHRLLGWLLLAGVVALEGAYLADHSLYAQVEDDVGRSGPLFLALPAMYATFAGVGLTMVLQGRGLQDAAGRLALRLGGIAFVVEPLFWSSHWVTDSALNGFPSKGIPVIFSGLELATLAVSLLAATVVVLDGFHLARRVLAGPILLASALASGVGVALLRNLSGWGFTTQSFLLFGVDAFWHVCLVVLTTVAVLRHRFLVMEKQIRFSMRQGTVAAIFVAVFFAVSESAQYKFGESLRNQYLGIVAAGLLVFAIAPLQRFADRLLGAAVPSATVGRLSAPDRAELFREQARFAWLDGALTRRERQRLDQLRERLGLEPEQAAVIESEAAGSPASGGRRGARPRTTKA